MYNSRSISSKDLASLEYPFIYRDEESLELSELYDTEPPTKDRDVSVSQKPLHTRENLSRSTGLNSSIRPSIQASGASRPRLVSPIVNPTLTIDEHTDIYRSDLQNIISDLNAYTSMIDNPNLSAQDLPKVYVEKLDMGSYRNKFAAKKELSTALIQQTMELRKRTSQAQSLLDAMCTQSLGEKMSGRERPSRPDTESTRPVPVYDRLLPVTRSPIYEQNCRVIWSSSDSFILLAHIKHSSDIGTDVFVAHIDTELSRFQQDSTEDTAMHNGSVICTLTLWFKKQGNQLLLRFLCDEFLSAYRPTLQGSDPTVPAEPKHLLEKCSLDTLGTALGLRQATIHDMLQLTFRDISSHAAKDIIAMVLDVFQRFYAQLQTWGALRTQQIVFLTYYQTCPRFFTSKSDRLMNFLASQTAIEPELKILSTKSTTVQTLPGSCLYCKLYVAQSLESVVVRFSLQAGSAKHLVLTFTAFKFSSGEAISDDDVRLILSSC